MFETFTAMFQAKDGPNPHDIAEATVKLLALPKGARPIRTIVGQPFGADLINQQTAPVQAQAVAGLGLGHLATLTGLSHGS